MSLTTSKNIEQLKEEVFLRLGNLDLLENKKMTKTELLQILRNYYLKQKYPDHIPKDLQLILEIESPMLCFKYKDLNESEKEQIWIPENNWYLEEKENGIRMLIVYIKEVKFNFYSRNNSTVDYLPVNYKANIDLSNVNTDNLPDSFIIDTEVIPTEPCMSYRRKSKIITTTTQLQTVQTLLSLDPEISIPLQEKNPLIFKIFDVLYKSDKWLVDKKLRDRLIHLNELKDLLVSAKMRVERPLSAYKNKRGFFQNILNLKGEGVVAKNLDSPYIPNLSRKRNGFVKVKRTMSGSMSDTIDAFITGFEESSNDKQWAGTVGTLKFSVYLDKIDGSSVIHEIAHISGITEELRNKLTEIVDGKIQLKKEFYNQVATIDGHCVSPKEKRLRHAILCSFRNDKTTDECRLSEESLNNLIM